MSASNDRTTARTDGIDAAADRIEERARPLREAGDLDALVDAVGDRRYVLLGEASHGTAEFYRRRAQLTARLIREGEVSFVAVEGDWPPCQEVNRYVRGERDAADATELLGEFDRWPTWMWANWEVAAFVEWLREYNAGRDAAEQVGFYGLDVYSLFESMGEVIDYLESVDPEAADRARDAYRCFEPYGEDAREYGRSTRLTPDSCEEEVIDVLTDVVERTDEYDRRDADESGELAFGAEQNALVARDAERYYRSMVEADAESWNVRDRHMAETLDRLLDRGRPDATGVVWAHNTHVGDARATDMPDRGRTNLGAIVRERAGPDEVGIVGFGTHRGRVIAGEAWDAPREAMRLPEAREGSVGDAFHRAGDGDRLLLADDVDPDGPLGERRGHRAVGVVYDPDREWGNYVPTVLPDRYDAFVHVEETSALHPLDVEADTDEPPEAYPWGL